MNKIGGYSGKTVGAKAIYFGVFGGSAHGHLVDIYPNGFLGAQHQCGNGKNAAAGSHIQYACMFNGELLQQLAAQAGGVVGAAAKGHAGIQCHHQFFRGGGVFLPAGAYHQPFTQVGGVIKTLPGIGPVLLGQRLVGLDAIGNALCFQPVGKEGGGFGWIFLRGQVQVQDRFGAAAGQKILIDEINVGNLRHQLQHIAIILDVDAVGDGHLRNRFCCLGILGAYGYFQVSPVHGGSFLTRFVPSIIAGDVKNLNSLRELFA